MAIGDTLIALAAPWGYYPYPAWTYPTSVQYVGGGSDELMPVYSFSGSGQKYVDWHFRMPYNFSAGNGVNVIVDVFDFTSGDGSRWEAAWRRVDNTEVYWSASHTYDYNGITITGSGNLGQRKTGTISFSSGSDMDSVVGGDDVIFRFRRDAFDGDDDYVGYISLARLHLVEA